MLSTLFLNLLEFRRRHRWALLGVALLAQAVLASTVGFRPVPTAAVLLSIPLLLALLAAPEPVLVALLAALPAASLTASGAWGFGAAATVAAAARLVALRKWRGQPPLAQLGSVALAGSLAIAFKEPRAVAAVLLALMLAPLGTDILLPHRRGGAPRLHNLLGGLYVFCYALFLQLFLLRVAMPILKWPAERLRRAGSTGIRGLMRSFPYGVREFPGIDETTLQKPAIIVSNHQSSLDIVLVLGLPGDVRLTTSPRVWDEPWLGRSARALGHLRVDDDLLDNARRVLDEGASVHFFPEGTRSHDGYPARFRRGAFELAVQLGADVLPILLCDTREAVPRDAYWVEHFHLRVRALDRIEPGDDSRALQKKVQALVRREFAREMKQLNTAKNVRRKVLRLYRYIGWRAFFGVRAELRAITSAPEPALPEVELRGCGYGVAAHVLSACYPRARIHATDPDPYRIAIAKRSAESMPRLSFEVAEAAPEPS